MTGKKIVAIVVFIIVLISIPFGLVLVKQTQIFGSKAADKQPVLPSQVAKLSPTKAPKEVPQTIDDLQKLIEEGTNPGGVASPSSTPTPTTSIPQVSFGPSLSLLINIEGRPTGKNAAKVFVGLAGGAISQNPTYIISYSVDFPDSGSFNGLSLAGLTQGSTYTAYLKGPAQITSAASFVVGPDKVSLNNSQALILTTGDLNDDNIINAADYAIIKNLYNTTSSSTNWNERTDFNLDRIINNLDVGYIIKNYGKTGMSGTWYSPPPATQSGSLKPNIGSPSGGYEQGSSTNEQGSSRSGYWLWIPQI